jgi:hypothetical protein
LSCSSVGSARPTDLLTVRARKTTPVTADMNRIEDVATIMPTVLSVILSTSFRVRTSRWSLSKEVDRDDGDDIRVLLFRQVLILASMRFPLDDSRGRMAAEATT